MPWTHIVMTHITHPCYIMNPKISPDDLRKFPLQAALTAAEADQVKAAAHNDRRTVSDWIRNHLLNALEAEGLTT